MKTYCFGRHLVDMPREAQMIGGQNEYLGTQINAEKMTREAFAQLVENGIAKRKQVEDLYAYDKEIAIGDNGVIVLGFRDASRGRAHSIDTFKFDKGWGFVTSSDPYRSEKMDSLTEKFTRYVKAVRYRPEYDIPKVPGVCLVNGFIANGENTKIYETAALQFNLKDNPDVVIRIESERSYRKWPSLLEKLKESGILKKYANKIKNVRSGKREVNGMHGEEFLLAFPSDDQTGTAQDFTWETQGELDNPDKPTIQLSITTGEGVFGVTAASSIETAKLVKIFDAIVGSIRLRPTEEPAPPPPQSKAPPTLGSGDACPRTGLWRCLETGEKRRLAEGQPMPEARYTKVARGWLNRLRGVREVFSHAGPGHWKWAGETPPVASLE
ncbi:MAG: hypothetical protein LBL48_09190 [Azoarcus sp.]|nr:hypothetical protein [Azoarcus sp.]